MASSSEVGTKAQAPTDISPESPDHYPVDHCTTVASSSRPLAIQPGLEDTGPSPDQDMEHTPVVFEDVTLHQATLLLPKTGEEGGSCATGGRASLRPLQLTSAPAAHRDCASWKCGFLEASPAP